MNIIDCRIFAALPWIPPALESWIRPWHSPPCFNYYVRNSHSYVIWTRRRKMTLSSRPYGVMVVAKIRTHYFESVLSFLELICPPVDSFFLTQKHVLTSKQNLLVLFKEQYLHPWMSCRGRNIFTRIRLRIGIRTVYVFATHQFHTLPRSLMPFNGPTSLAIISRP